MNSGLGDNTIRSLAVSGTNLFAGTYNRGMFLTSNNGTNWTPVANGLNAKAIWSIAVSGANIFAGSRDSGVFRSTDNGVSWNEANNGITNKSILSILARGANVFAGTYGGDVFHSTNMGENWERVNNGLTTPAVLSFAAVENNIFAGTSYGIYLSSNNGTSWIEISTGLPNEPYVYTLAINGTDIFAGTYQRGVWRRTLSEIIPVELKSFTATTIDEEIILNWSTASEKNNRGFEIERSQMATVKNEMWTKIGFVDGYGTTTEEHSYSFVDKHVTHGKYLYKLKQIDYDGSITYSNEIEVELNLIAKFALEQNYPNPFNPSTRIHYQVSRNSYVLLKVYDVLGNEVATLKDEYKPAGSYEVEFNSSSGFRNPTSGIYFYQLKVENYSSTKKMLLLK